MNGNVTERGRIAAVFDIDGTLLPAPSLELRLVARLVARKEMRFGAVGEWLRSLIAQIVSGPRDAEELTSHRPFLDENKLYLAGVRVGVAEECIARQLAELEFFSEALAMMDWHRRRGHAIVLVSGTLAPLARAVCSMLKRDGEVHVRATELEVEGERWTGRVTGEAICGPGKERALLELASEHHFDLSRSYAYANSSKDRWLLSAVGHPIAVNPPAILARHARRRGWRIANWNERVCVRRPASCSTFPGGENTRQIMTEKLLWK